MTTENDLKAILEQLGVKYETIYAEIENVTSDLLFFQEYMNRMKKTSFQINLHFVDNYRNIFNWNYRLAKEDITIRVLLLLVIRELKKVFENHYEHYEENKLKYFPQFAKLDQLIKFKNFDSNLTKIEEFFDWGCGSINDTIFHDYDHWKQQNSIMLLIRRNVMSPLLHLLKGYTFFLLEEIRDDSDRFKTDKVVIFAPKLAEKLDHNPEKIDEILHEFAESISCMNQIPSIQRVR